MLLIKKIYLELGKVRLRLVMVVKYENVQRVRKMEKEAWCLREVCMATVYPSNLVRLCSVGLSYFTVLYMKAMLSNTKITSYIQLIALFTYFYKLCI